VEDGLSRKHKVPPIIWTILCFLLLVALAVTPLRYKGEVNLVFISLRFGLTLVVGVVGIRSYWRYWHHGLLEPTKSWLRRWRKWMLDEED
jgi:energy-coupling factor transporter transmembrane protein EcfT